jgi:hypothetical protein
LKKILDGRGKNRHFVSVIKILNSEESKMLGWDDNWIGTLGGKHDRHFVKTEKQAIAWVNRVAKNWPGKWAINESFHFQSGKSIGWGATVL